MDTAALRSSLGLTLLGTDVPVLLSAQLEYRVDDPYAVSATFEVGDGETVRWLFARDLLDEGLVHPVGEGDVHVSPGQDALGEATVRLVLSSPSGEAVLEAYADDILAFLEQCYALVRPGEESRCLDLDQTLARFLHEGAAGH
jgi:hypothetical protein